jgi:hypothetical protein
MGEYTKMRFLMLICAKRINRNAQQLKSIGRNTDQGAAQYWSIADHTKAVVRGPGGVDHPPLVPLYRSFV